MNSKNIELVPVEISRDNLVNIVAAWLHAIRKIPDQTYIENIQFGDLSKDQVHLKVVVKQEVDTIKF